MSFATPLKLAAAPLVLAAAAASLCFAAAGNSLDLYVASVALVGIILPPIVAAERDRRHALVIAAAIVDGVAIVWLLPALSSRTTLVQWLACYLVLAAYAWALCGMTRAVRSAAVASGLALAWLTWPVWMSPWLSASAAAWLAPAHPLLAINHVMMDLGVWTQQRLMYAYTTLGQDVPYTLPRSIWPCVLVHGAIGLTALLPAARKAVSPPPPPVETSEPRSTSASAAGT